jgi:hypothetical protein
MSQSAAAVLGGLAGFLGGVVFMAMVTPVEESGIITGDTLRYTRCYKNIAAWGQPGIGIECHDRALVGVE